tara:strand:- start:3557 stop:6550 length:2994 start_codon:yes stop_codon:yes gene_type:complete
MFAVAQYNPPNYNESNADGTNTIYSVTGDYGGLYNLYDLYFADDDTNNGVTKCEFSDDTGCHVAGGFGFSWEWHNKSFNYGLMSTNGCLKLLTSSSFSDNDYCSDYTPNQLGSGTGGYTSNATNTLFPFYTDLIYADMEKTGTEDSAMMFKAFDDYVIFGWYYMAEFGYHNNSTASSNSFEVYLFDYNDSINKCTTQTSKLCTDDERAEVNKPDNYGFLYAELDIENHDVLIGEQKDSTNYTQYLFYDDNTDNLGDGSVDNTFDDMDQGYIEGGGGILYSEADGEPVQCQSNPLYSTDCLLYDLAYLEYQCNLDSQYDSGCDLYNDNEVDEGLMCTIDPLYDPSCPGYDAAIAATSSGGYDPTTGLVTDPNTGEQYNTDGSVYDDGYVYDDGGVNGDFGDDPWMEGGVYDPRLDPNISYDDLNTEQQMLVDQGLSPQDAMFVTMGNEQIAALGEDPLAVQFNGHRPGEYVLDAVGGLENYDTQLHDTAMQQQSLEWDPTGNIDTLTADVWATEEFQQQETERLEGMVETYGEEFYSFTDQDYYEHDVATYGQEEVDTWHENIEFDEEGQINWDTFVEGTQEEEVWVTQDNELMPDYTEEEIFIESDEVFELIVEDEAFEELISEDELEELIAEESPEEIREEEVIEEVEEIVEEQEEVVEEQEEVREELAQEEVRVEKEAEQAVSSSGSSSKSRPTYQSVAIAQFVSEVSDDTQTANVIESVISDGGASASVQVDSGASQSFAGQNGSSFNNTGSQPVASSSSSDSTGIVADDSSQQQFEQVTGQVDTSIDVASTSVDVAQTSAFEVAEQQQEMMQEEQLFVENFDDGTGGISSTDVQFEDNLTEALATGTGLTEFLSQQAPNFQRFEVQNSVQEQRTTEAVESLADSVGSAVAQQNLEAQLQNIQEGEPTEEGGYADQTIAVAYIGYTAGFSAYTGEQVYSQGNAGFFDTKQMPDGKIDDNKMGFYRMAGNTQEKLYKMVLMQYGINPDEETQEQK